MNGYEKWNINGTYKLNSNKGPKEIDVTSRISPGGLFVLKGIYLLTATAFRSCRLGLAWQAKV